MFTQATPSQQIPLCDLYAMISPFCASFSQGGNRGRGRFALSRGNWGKDDLPESAQNDGAVEGQ
jgi:hypothetical protein